MRHSLLAFLLLLMAAVCSWAQVTPAAGAGFSVADFAVGSSAVTVPAGTGTVDKVVVTLNGINHGCLADWDVVLVGPGGQKLTIMSNIPDYFITGCSNWTGSLTIRDDAPSNMPAGAWPAPGGTYKPTVTDVGSPVVIDAVCGPCPAAAPFGTETFASQFAGTTADGTWTLYIDDNATDNTGSLASWSLTIYPAAVSTVTTVASSSSGNQSSTGASVTFTATVTSGGPVGAGSVTFKEGPTVLSGPSALNGSGQATFTTTALAEGRHTITAEYGGAMGYDASTGTVTQAVDDTTTVTGARFCNPGPHALPASGAAGAYPLRVYVSGLSLPISAMTISLEDLTYPAPNALQAMLVGPVGTAANALDFFSHTSNASAVTLADLVFTDTAASTVPSGIQLAPGSYQPTSASAANTWPAPAPAGPYQFASPAGAYTFSNVFNGGTANGWWSLYMSSAGAGSAGSVGQFCIEFGVPDLTIDKFHSGDFSQGQTGALYTIRVANGGTGPTSGVVTVTDTLPAGLTATALTGTGWSCTLATLSCTRSDALAAGASYPDIGLTVNVASNAAPSLTNSVTVTGGGDSGGGSDTDPTTIAAIADLTVAKAHAGNFSQGQTGATYTITVTNSGTGATVGVVTLQETIQTGLTATALTGTGWSCVLGTLACTRNDALAAGASYPAITLTVDVANNAPAVITNSVTVSGGGESNTSNNIANDPTTVTQVADMQVAKTHAGNFRQGQTGAAYTITVSNTGTGPSAGVVTVTETLPAGLTATGMSGTGWTCTVGTVTCTRGDALAAGSSYPAITLTVNVAANAAASLTNSVAVSGGGELNTSNNYASDATTVDQAADMQVAKSHAGNFAQGQTGAQYIITVSNTGSGPTTGMVSLTDTLPTGLAATGMSGTGWTCTLGTATCTRNDALAPGGSYPAITLTVNVANNAPASVTNSVTVSGGGELNTSNNSASDPATVTQLPDLAITKAHTGQFTRGQAGAYTITVRNAGSGATTGSVTMTDTLPAGLTAAAVSAEGWSCTLAPLSCQRSDALAAGAGYPPITLTVNVAVDAPASVANTATVAGTVDVDPNPANNTATDVATVLMIPDVTWPAPAAITYGTPLSGTQLNASSTTAGTFSYSPAAGAVLDGGPHVLTATFTPSDTSVWASTTASVTLTVNKATPVITWAAPAAITYGAALGGTELAATAGVPGSFAYTPPAGTVLSAVTHTLSVVFTPSDTVNYNNATASVSLTVNKATPLITWAAPPSIVYGTVLGPAQLNAGATVDGAFAYSPAAGATLPAGSNTLNATFTPTDSANYNNATASVTLVVNKAAPAITWATPAPIAPGTALGPAQLNATATTAGAFAYSPSSGTVLPIGTHTLNVTFTPADPANYSNAAASVTQVVNEKGQGINFPPIGDRWYRDTPVALGATASSGLPVSYTVVSGPATLNGSVLAITGPGRIIVRASQAGGDMWEPALDVEQSFVAGYRTEIRAAQGLTVWIDDRAVVGGSAFIWDPGTTHRIAVLPFQAQRPGSGFRFASWSDGGAREHIITAEAADAAYTASFVLQFQLTVNVQPDPAAGAVLPGTGFYDAGTTVAFDARPNAGYHFVNYSGDIDGSSAVMTGPRTVIATFAAGPKLQAVADSASLRQGPLTSGGLFTVFGSGMSGGTFAISDSAGVERMVTVLYDSTNQVNLITPEGLAPGPAVLRYTGADGVAATLAVEIAAVGPGLFAANMDGRGAPAGQVMRVNAAGQAVFSGALAACGSVAGSCKPEPIDLGASTDEVFIVLYGTGFRGYTSIRAVVGGVEAVVAWAGAQPTLPGLDQVNVRLPRELAGRGQVELIVAVDGRAANVLGLEIR